MAKKIFNGCITALATAGVVTWLGAAGTMDYNVEMGIVYPLSETIKTFLVGALFMLPAITREVNKCQEIR